MGEYTICKNLERITGKSTHAYILDRGASCGGEINNIKQSSEYDIKIIYVLHMDSTNTGRVESSVVACGKFVELGGWRQPNTVWKFALTQEQRDLITLEVASLKKKDENEFGSAFLPNKVYLVGAIFKVCFAEPIHWALGTAGYFCDVCDILDGALYALEGDMAQAKWTIISGIPGVGTPLAKVGKAATKGNGIRGIARTYFANKKHLIKYDNAGKIIIKPSSRNLGKAMGNRPNDGFTYQAHHLLMGIFFKNSSKSKHSWAKRLMEKHGVHPDDAFNGVWLRETIGGKSFHNGGHGRDTSIGSLDWYVNEEMKNLYNIKDESLFYSQTNVFVSNLKTEIERIQDIVISTHNPGISLNAAWRLYGFK